MRLERNEDGFSIDAAALAKLLKVPAAQVQELMRSGAITSICERGEGEDEGKFRLTFFLGHRRVRLEVDGEGAVLKRFSTDFGDRPFPRRRPAAG